MVGTDGGRPASRTAILGCEGKWALTPNTVALANAIYAAPPKEVARAEAMLGAMREGQKKGMGGVSLNGVLVDAASILSQASPDGVVGSDMVYEHVHLRPKGNYLLARAMFLQIASKLSRRDGSSFVPANQLLSEAECERELALTQFDRIRMASEMLGRIQRPPFTGQMNHSEQLLRLSMEANVPPEDPKTTAAEYEWAISRWPADRLLHFNFGVFLLNYDRNAALAQLRMSRPYDGFPVFSPDGSIL